MRGETGRKSYSALESLFLTALFLVPLKRVRLGMAQLAWRVRRTLLAFVEAATIVQGSYREGLDESIAEGENRG